MKPEERAWEEKVGEGQQPPKQKEEAQGGTQAIKHFSECSERGEETRGWEVR